MIRRRIIMYCKKLSIFVPNTLCAPDRTPLTLASTKARVLLCPSSPDARNADMFRLTWGQVLTHCVLWSQVTKHNTSLHSYSAKYSRPRLGRFYFWERSKNMPAARTQARKQSSLLSKTKHIVKRCVLFYLCAPARTRTRNGWSEASCDIHFTTGAV